MALFHILCWPLIFLLRLRLPSWLIHSSSFYKAVYFQSATFVLEFRSYRKVFTRSNNIPHPRSPCTRNRIRSRSELVPVFKLDPVLFQPVLQQQHASVRTFRFVHVTFAFHPTSEIKKEKISKSQSNQRYHCLHYNYHYHCHCHCHCHYHYHYIITMIVIIISSL